jgi:hypothetical protein
MNKSSPDFPNETNGTPGADFDAELARQPELLLKPEVRTWAEAELDDPITGAFASWHKYNTLLSSSVPSMDSLLEEDPHIGEKLNYLFHAKALLRGSDRMHKVGNISESMHLVAIPWLDFQNNLSSFESWMYGMRTKQLPKVPNADEMSVTLKVQLRPDGDPMYRNPKLALYDVPDNTDAFELQTASEYLADRVSESGASGWGVMLVQTAVQANVPLLAGQSANDLTFNGLDHLTGPFGIKTDALGIFEWLALTLQSDPQKLALKDRTLLLANRIVMGDTLSYVPCAGWDDERACVSILNSLPNARDGVEPRLAVM